MHYKHKLLIVQPHRSPTTFRLIAVVGCDGTGKSTLTTDLVKSLQQHWQTERRYLGLLSGEDGDKIKRLPLVGVWLERRLAAKSSKTQSMKTKSPALWAAVIMYCFSLRRMANLRKVQRLAQSGVLVVSDRFPQAEISGFYYDGPGLASNVRPENQHVSGAARTAFIPTNGAISPGINYSPGH